MRARRKKTWFRRRPWIVPAALLGVGFILALADRLGCGSAPVRGEAQEDLSSIAVSGDARELLVTGYCNCGRCCGWRRRWYVFGEPVYNYGRMKGRPKEVGVTSSGTVAGRGTIAADISAYPYGTKMDIPGYGVGVVRDIGGSIKGEHIDLWFPSHEEALAWGSRKLMVKVEKAKK